jgi:hypothetical protein
MVSLRDLYEVSSAANKIDESGRLRPIYQLHAIASVVGSSPSHPWWKRGKVPKTWTFRYSPPTRIVIQLLQTAVCVVHETKTG